VSTCRAGALVSFSRARDPRLKAREPRASLAFPWQENRNRKQRSPLGNVATREWEWEAASRLESGSERPSLFAQVGYAARIHVYTRVLSSNPVAVIEGRGLFWAVRQFAGVPARCGTGVPDVPPFFWGCSRLLVGEGLENA
jgi:hypothetical protein